MMQLQKVPAQSRPDLSQHNISHIPKDSQAWTWDMDITEHETVMFVNKNAPKRWRSSDEGRLWPGTYCSGMPYHGTYHHGLFWAMGQYVSTRPIPLETIMMAHFLSFGLILRKCSHLLKSIWYQDVFEKNAVYPGLFIVCIKGAQVWDFLSLGFSWFLLHKAFLGWWLWG